MGIDCVSFLCMREGIPYPDPISEKKRKEITHNNKKEDNSSDVLWLSVLHQKEERKKETRRDVITNNCWLRVSPIKIWKKRSSLTTAHREGRTMLFGWSSRSTTKVNHMVVAVPCWGPPHVCLWVYNVEKGKKSIAVQNACAIRHAARCS
jgi:hypothetical protein